MAENPHYSSIENLGGELFMLGPWDITHQCGAQTFSVC